MKSKTTLQQVLDAFLQAQKLPDCSIVFEPYYAKVTRRSKRSTVPVPDADISRIKMLSSRSSVDTLLKRLVYSSEVIRSWTEEGHKRYIARLYDDQGVWVKPETRLGEIRKRSQARDEQASTRVKRLLAKALQKCDRVLEPGKVNDIAWGLLKERKGA